MRRKMGIAAASVALVVGLAGCGGDTEEAEEQLGVADGTDGTEEVEEPSPSSSNEGVDDADAGSSAGDADDILADFLAGLGLTTDIVSDEERDCLNAELRPLYPDGFPDTMGQEDLDAINAAAETCDVTLL